jgi:hypothetical protein
VKSRNLVITSVVAVVFALAVLGTVGYGIYAGLNAHRSTTPTGAIVTGSVPGASRANAATNTSAALDAVAPANSSAIAQPAPGAFEPGFPPFSQGGAGGDGINGWGVAYREVKDPSAQPDSALIKAAYQDAEKKISELGAATGTKVGKLVSITDFSTNQSYFKPCVYSGPPPSKPVPGAAEGSTGSGSAAGAPTTTIAPAPPVQTAPCQANGNQYVVVWVFVRHAIG